MRKILYTSYFKHPNPTRMMELKHCMIRNVANHLIDHIVVLLEGNAQDFPELLGIKKIKIVEAPRPTFQDFFDIANILSGDGDYSIIANTDIYFDDTISLLDSIDMHNTCLALSRWHYYTDKRIELHNEKFSQDVWIFRGKIAPIGYAHFPMGQPGCDNRIAHEIETAGYDIFNPAHSIRCIHYHMSEVRNYPAGKVMKPYLPVPLCALPISKPQQRYASRAKTW